MTQPEAYEAVLEILKKEPFEIQNTDKFTENTLLPTFLDSLEIIDLTMRIEEEVGCSITDFTVESWNTIGDVATTYRNFKDE
jgi:acyl carrier protein